ncbi:MAG: hypothetical protein ACI9WC_002846 [Arenicella sp.]|jgi:hypothetical protein
MHRLIVIFFCITLSACASHYGAVTIVSSPSGADIISDQDGSILGVTPATVWWKEDNGHRKYRIVRLRKEGYREKVASFWLSMSHTSLKKAQKSPTSIEEMLQKKDS